jgi:hypothetical protein
MPPVIISRMQEYTRPVAVSGRCSRGAGEVIE